MDRIKELGLDVRTFFNAKPAFMAGVLDAMLTRRIAKEKAELDKLAKQYAKRDYACQPDAEKEIAVFTTKKLPKVQYHRVDF